MLKIWPTVLYDNIKFFIFQIFFSSSLFSEIIPTFSWKNFFQMSKKFQRKMITEIVKKFLKHYPIDFLINLKIIKFFTYQSFLKRVWCLYSSKTFHNLSKIVVLWYFQNFPKFLQGSSSFSQKLFQFLLIFYKFLFSFSQFSQQENKKRYSCVNFPRELIQILGPALASPQKSGLCLSYVSNLQFLIIYRAPNQYSAYLRTNSNTPRIFSAVN